MKFQIATKTVVIPPIIAMRTEPIAEMTDMIAPGVCERPRIGRKWSGVERRSGVKEWSKGVGRR